MTDLPLTLTASWRSIRLSTPSACIAQHISLEALVSRSLAHHALRAERRESRINLSRKDFLR